jgi:hypothetical protein
VKRIALRMIKAGGLPSALSLCTFYSYVVL